jgi:hypothetical protein
LPAAAIFSYIKPSFKFFYNNFLTSIYSKKKIILSVFKNYILALKFIKNQRPNTAVAAGQDYNSNSIFRKLRKFGSKEFSR